MSCGCHLSHDRADHSWKYKMGVTDRHQRLCFLTSKVQEVVAIWLLLG